MATRHWAGAFAAISFTQPAVAAEYFTSLTSTVYQAPGTQQELAARGLKCISQILTVGTTDSPIIIHSDLAAGTVVARSAMKYGSFPEWQIRSRFTFEAKDGRFRVVQTQLERFNDMGGGWGRIGKWAGSGWKKAEDAFQMSEMVVSQCVSQAPKRDDW
jgi:hypothetical protein